MNIDNEIQQTLYTIIEDSIPIPQQGLHKAHVDLAMDLVDDIDAYDDALYIKYHKEYMRMKHE